MSERDRFKGEGSRTFVSVRGGLSQVYVGKEYLESKLGNCLGRLVPERGLPLGVWILRTTELSSDSDTMRGLETMVRHLQTRSLAIVFPHHSLLDSLALGGMVGSRLQAMGGQSIPSQMIIPVAMNHWCEAGLEEFWGSISRLSNAKLLPVVRSKDEALMREGKLIVQDDKGKVLSPGDAVNFYNNRYFLAAADALSLPGAVVFVAASGERRGWGDNGLDRGVALLLTMAVGGEAGEGVRVIGAAAVPGARWGKLSHQVRLGPELIDLRQAALSVVGPRQAGVKRGGYKEAMFEAASAIMNRTLGRLEGAEPTPFWRLLERRVVSRTVRGGMGGAAKV